MKKVNFILATLSVAGFKSFTPVQVQKLLFLLDDKISSSVGGPLFDFVPYDYGPFDKKIYRIMDSLCQEGYVKIHGRSWHTRRTYQLTNKGLETGRSHFEELPNKSKEHSQQLVQWLLQLSFSQLMSFIYENYPDMRVNSVFQD